MEAEALRGASHRMVACPYCHRICLEEHDDKGYLVHLAACPRLDRKSLPSHVREALSVALAHAKEGAGRGRTAGYDTVTEDGSVEEQTVSVSVDTWESVFREVMEDG